MRVLLVQNYGGVGGGSRSGFDVAQLFKKAGHTVDMIIENPSDAYIKMLNNGSINIVKKHPPLLLLNFHNASGPLLKTWIYFLSTLKFRNEWMYFFKEQKQYELVVLNSSVLCPLCGLLDEIGIKNIVITRETFRKNHIINKIQRLFMEKSDAVAYLTDFDKNEWNANNNQFVLPDVVDPTLFIRKTINHNIKNDFLYLGGFSYYKGALTLLKAALEIVEKHPNVHCHFSLLGNTYEEYDNWSIIKKAISYKHLKYRDQCISYLERIKSINSDAVSVVGLTVELSSYYSRCKAVVFPVTKVHQPRPAYEAGYFSKPIVIPDYPNFSDNIKDGVNGYYYMKDDVQSLVEVIMRIARNSEEATRLGEYNRLNTERLHSFDYASNVLDNILKSICFTQ